MKTYDHNRSARRQRSTVSLPPDEMARRHKLALRWREEWRAELNGVVLPDPRPPKPKSSARFARGIARVEFGRFYWRGPHKDRSGKAGKREPTDKGGALKRR